MTFKELINEVESSAFDIRFSVLSGLKILTLTLAHDETIRQLITHIHEKPEASKIVLQRLTALAQKDVPAEYAHPDDMAIAAYVYVLAQVNIETAQQATDIINNVHNLWWSRRLAQNLLNESLESSEG